MSETLAANLDNEFSQILQMIAERRSHASQVINNEVLVSAWEIGAFLSARLRSGQWGSKTVTQLAEYLKVQEPSLRGYSRRNLYNMVTLFDSYSSEEFMRFSESFDSSKSLTKQFASTIDVSSPTEIVQFGTAQLAADEFVQFEAAQMPAFLNLTTFTNHIEILNRCKRIDERLFYVLYAYKEHLNIKELRRCLQTDTFSAFTGNRHNLSQSLMAAYPQAPSLFKDELFLDFLGLPPRHHESKLRKGIVNHVKEFILELGKDFIFIGEHYPLNVGGKTYKLDLLFFHRGLQCLVGIELKSGEFKPKDLGQLEFYLEALDRDVRRSNENPSIGILLCQDVNRSVVEYALSRSLSPTMIAKYKRLLVPKDVLRKSLDEFGGLLPSGEQVGDDDTE